MLEWATLLKDRMKKNAFREPDKDLGEDEELQFPVQEFAGSIWLWCSSSGSLGAFRDISNVDFLLFVKKRNSTLLQRNPWHQPRVSEGGIPWNSTPARRVALLRLPNIHDTQKKFPKNLHTENHAVGLQNNTGNTEIELGAS